MKENGIEITPVPRKNTIRKLPQNDPAAIQ
jgi:hypothetical protein